MATSPAAALRSSQVAGEGAAGGGGEETRELEPMGLPRLEPRSQPQPLPSGAQRVDCGEPERFHA